ncbi:hypothetical protein H1Q59_02475 [Holosporaceae bacterium 'Namur']|nr:hypothetical protein [Holosporaceae bacterium 'Namur']
MLKNISISLIALVLIQGCSNNVSSDPALFDKLQKKYESMNCNELKAEILFLDSKLNSAYKGREPGIMDAVNPISYIPGVLSGQKMFNENKSKEINGKLTILNTIYQKKRCVGTMVIEK